MKKFKLIAGAVLVAVGVINFSVFKSSDKLNTTYLLKSNIEAQAAGEWHWPWENEDNQRIEPVTVKCSASNSTTTIYFSQDSQGNITGTGVMVNGGIQITGGYQSGGWIQKTTESGCSEFEATRIFCPTDGSSSCTEYNPCY